VGGVSGKGKHGAQSLPMMVGGRGASEDDYDGGHGANLPPIGSSMTGGGIKGGAVQVSS
jgi:hypothetical protein